MDDRKWILWKFWSRKKTRNDAVCIQNLVWFYPFWKQKQEFYHIDYLHNYIGVVYGGQ
jgi:hypothetical protein